MLRLSRSLSRFETQDIKTQLQFNRNLYPSFLFHNSLSLTQSLILLSEAQNICITKLQIWCASFQTLIIKEFYHFLFNLFFIHIFIILWVKPHFCYKISPGSYQRLDLFIKQLIACRQLLCLKEIHSFAVKRSRDFIKTT